MADWVRWLIQSGYTQICVARGTVSLPGEGDGAGELQLWYHKGSNKYGIYARKTAGDGVSVCELLMFYSFTFKSVLIISNLYK